MNADIKETISELLTQIPIFKTYSIKEIQQRYFRCDLARIVKLAAGDEIIREGAYADWIYWLIEGAVEVLRNYRPVTTLSRSGDMFGEMSVMDSERRTATVRAATNSFVLGLDMSILKGTDSPGVQVFCNDVARVIKNRLTDTTRRLSVVDEKRAHLQEELDGARRTIAGQEIHIKKARQEIAHLKAELADQTRRVAELEQKAAPSAKDNGYVNVVLD